MMTQEEKYQKALKDVIEAIKSMQELTPQQQRRLAEELWGVAMAAELYRIMQQM